MDPKELLIEYGPRYFPYVVFFCATLENDVTFLMAGIYAASLKQQHLPHPNPWLGVAAGVAGALCHDSFWFYVARHRAAWIKNTRVWKSIGPQIEQWAARFGVWELALARLIPGTRNPSVFFWGLQHLRIPTFYAVNFVALAIWGSAVTMLGYFFGQRVELFIGKMRQKHLGRDLMIAFVITLIIYLALRLFAQYEIKKHGKPPEDPRAD
jgi:membrane protein DedA with SNARE-associated domain